MPEKGERPKDRALSGFLDKFFFLPYNVQCFIGEYTVLYRFENLFAVKGETAWTIKDSERIRLS